MDSLSVLIATDLSAESQQLAAAAKLFGNRRREVVLLHVQPRSMPITPVIGGAVILPSPLALKSVPDSDETSERTHLEALKAQLDDSARVSTLLRKGSPAFVICETAVEHSTDLILLASHGSPFLYRLLVGSTSQYVMNHAQCHFLILRPDPGDREETAESFRPASDHNKAPALPVRHPIPDAAGQVS